MSEKSGNEASSSSEASTPKLSENAYNATKQPQLKFTSAENDRFRTPVALPLHRKRSEGDLPGSSGVMHNVTIGSNRTPRKMANNLMRSHKSISSTTFTPVSRVLSTTTPHSTTTSLNTPGQHQDSAVLIGIVEGRGMARGEIGMSVIDLKNPELILCQFPDSTTYAKVLTKLQLYNPIEVIMPRLPCEHGNMTALYKRVIEQLPNINIALVERKYFNETIGLQNVKSLCIPEYDTVIMELNNRYYCLAATAALLKYAEHVQNIVYAPNSLKIMFKGIDNTMMIDATTARNLELIVNLKNPKSNESLFGILNYTKTRGGARLLRANILQPPCDEDTVNTRLDCIDELVNNSDMFYAIQAVLSKFLEVGHLISICVQMPKQESPRASDQKISTVIQLKHTVELVKPLKSALVGCQHPMFKAFEQLLDDQRFETIIELIRTVIHDDTRYQKGLLNMRTQKCFAVKPYINGLLDIARRTYTENVDDVADLVRQLSEKHNIPMKTGYNATRGFFIQIPTIGHSDTIMDSLPNDFIKKIKSRNCISCTTEDMIKLNDRIEQSLNEIYSMTNVIITGLLENIREHVGCLYKLSETVSTLDMFVSFTHACSVSNYVRPEFTNTLGIKCGRHPILEKICNDNITPNDTYMFKEANFAIVTGPNMSGKSTYLRQVALMQVMAQIGMYVPAEYVSFRLTDQLFSRIGSADDMEANLSTFMLEMKETNYILQNITDKSLVIIDELGRGTSVEEGVGICWAVSEALIDKDAFVFFATHFMELAQLQAMYPNVTSLQFDVQADDGDEATGGQSIDEQRFRYTHVAKPGFTTAKHYGLRLAKMSTLPREVVNEAELIAQELESKVLGVASDDATNREYSRSNDVIRFAANLMQIARNSRLDEDSLREHLKSIKEEYLREQCQDDAMTSVGNDSNTAEDNQSDCADESNPKE